MPYPLHMRSRNFKFLTLSSGNISFSSTAFAAIPGVSDITLQALVGDVLQIGFEARYNNEAFAARTTAALLVAGAVTTTLGDPSYGIPAWYAAASTYVNLGVPVFYTLTSQDISTTNIATVRFLNRVETAGTRTIQANSEYAQFWVRNLGPQSS